MGVQVGEKMGHAATGTGGLRVNIGCGLAGAPGWYNIDNSLSVLLARLPLGRRLFRTPDWPSDVRRHDVARGLPFADASVDCLYSSHVFEHFSYGLALHVAKESFRVLRPEGVLRIVVPDLQILVADYLRDPQPMASHRFVDRLLLRHNWRDLLHRGSHHSQMFDERSLAYLLRQAGFGNPQKRVFGESRIPDVRAVELESRAPESLYMEAIKD